MIRLKIKLLSKLFKPIYKSNYDLNSLKGSDRLCKVVELSMQSCGQIFYDLFETYETVTRSINPEFERKVDVQT